MLPAMQAPSGTTACGAGLSRISAPGPSRAGAPFAPRYADSFSSRRTAFAVARIADHERPIPFQATEESLCRIEGVYQVRVDAGRRTIQVLYDGNPRTLHRLCARVCQTGVDVLACTCACDIGSVSGR